MSDVDEYPTPDVPVEAVQPRALLERIDRGEPVRLLDVRASSEYEKWHIEGPSVTIVNIPYFEFLDGVTADHLDRIPDGDGPLIAVCAKGGASEYVAGLLIQEGVQASNLAEGMVGWGEIYRAREVTQYEGPGRVVQYQRPSSGCLAYLVVSEGEAAVVDPLLAFADRYIADAAEDGASLTHALDTHIHADHVSGVRQLARDSGATAVIPADSEARGVEYEQPYTTISDGDEIAIGEAQITAVSTPGHTSGMTAYRVGNLLLTGDGLFVESVARPDLEAGAAGAAEAAGQLYDSLTDRVLSLPDDTIVGPAHFSDATLPADDGTYTARLGSLRDRMAALEMDRDAFIEFIIDDMPPRPANFEEIIATNLGHRPVGDADEVFTLEQGPNNCAATSESIAGD